MKVFVNPAENIKELPIKRFYGQVLHHQPQFDPSGKNVVGVGRFVGLPEETLLTMALDTPSSWLVASKESIYDLDNIKLSTVKTDIYATYELEHILIEGHSRDVTEDQPPRGVQLLLQTEVDPKFAGTIIMANLGYFQFKVNPGVYNLALQDGRSKDIFKIDSAGHDGIRCHSWGRTDRNRAVEFQRRDCLSQTFTQTRTGERGRFGASHSIYREPGVERSRICGFFTRQSWAEL